MATSGSFKTTGYDGRYLVFSWSVVSSDILSNTTTIRWSLTGAGTGSAAWYKAGDFKVVIDGETVFASSTRINLYNGTEVWTGTKDIKHNPNGKKTFSASAQAAIYLSSINATGAGSWELPDIPIMATITDAPNFNDEENPTIKYTNPSGNNVDKVEVCITKPNGVDIVVPYREVSKSGGSYTFPLTDAERKALRQLVTKGNTAAIKFYIRTTIGGSYYHFGTAQKTLTLINYMPTINPALVSLDIFQVTGNNPEIFIKGNNQIQFKINPVARKEASIVSQSIQCGAKKSTKAEGVLIDVVENQFVITATDSRGNTTTNTYTLDMINYIPLTASFESSIELQDDNTVKLNVELSGNCFTGSLGAGNNEVEVEVEVYEIDSNGEEKQLFLRYEYPPMSEDNTYNLNVQYSGNSYASKYQVYVSVYDMITSLNTIEGKVLSVYPVFDWSNEDFNFNVPVAIQGETIADFPIEEGTEAMGSNGTWYWRKWKSGKAECWGIRNYGNMAVNKAWGSLFISDNYTQSLPSGLFNAAPITHIEIHGTTSGMNMIAKGGEQPSATSTGGFLIARGATITLSQVYISFHCIGNWM